MVQREADAERRHDGEGDAACDELALQSARAFHALSGIRNIAIVFGSQCVIEFVGNGKLVCGVSIDWVVRIIRKQILFVIVGAGAVIEVLGIDIGIHIRFLSSLDIG